MRELRTKHRLTSKELTRWMAFYELEPWGSKPADERAALVAWAACDVTPRPKRSAFLIQREEMPVEGVAPDEVELERFFAGGGS